MTGVRPPGRTTRTTRTNATRREARGADPAAPTEGGVLQNLGAPGANSRAGAAQSARTLGGRDAARGQRGGLEPVATVGRAAPSRAGDLTPGGISGALRTDEPSGRGTARG